LKNSKTLLTNEKTRESQKKKKKKKKKNLRKLVNWKVKKGEGRRMETSSILPQSLTKEKKDLTIEMVKISHKVE